LRDADAVVSVAVIPEARQVLAEAGEELAAALPNGDAETIVVHANGSGEQGSRGAGEQGGGEDLLD